jgi:cellulose 1,4-beta-cellobiosidase
MILFLHFVYQGTRYSRDNTVSEIWGAQFDALLSCDAQCPTDLKFINGETNCEGWKPQANSESPGNGKYGSCCAEVDIWGANWQASAVTPHVCKCDGQTRCSGVSECGGQDGEARFTGLCDEDGRDLNSWRLGDKAFFGPGLTVDTKSPFGVVTQFVGSPVTEIKRKYVQNRCAQAHSLQRGLIGLHVSYRIDIA